MGDEVQSDQDIALGVADFPSERDYQMYCLKHSTSHLMAAAVQQMFPDAKFAIGPPIKNGFYYDMELPRPLTPEDLEELERRMKEISKGGFEFQQETWDKAKALEYFGSRGQKFKVELFEGISGETVSTYKTGDFIDLCAGPHVRRSNQCKHFKLTSIAGAYWRGNEHNPMLQRVYRGGQTTRSSETGAGTRPVHDARVGSRRHFLAAQGNRYLSRAPGEDETPARAQRLR
jgi:threonyl-tRNA synthetase